MFARNVCFSRSEWQDPRLMHPFPGAIGRFRIHGARILPPRPPFRVERPEITHSAKNLPALPGFSAAADRSLAERALRPAAHARLTCRAGPCHLARAHHLRFPSPAPTTCASRCPLQPRATRVPCPSRTSRGLRRIQQTSGTARATQCGHKNGIPVRGSH